MPFILLKKRAKVVTSAKWSWSEIWVMLSEVWSQGAVEMIEKIGAQNWLIKRM